jgi:Zn-dependent M28 family amino/carboxypeptidase
MVKALGPLLAMILCCAWQNGSSQPGKPTPIALQRQALAAITRKPAERLADSVQLMEHTAALSHPNMEGRRVGTAGGAKARAYILAQLKFTAAQPMANDWLQPFEVVNSAGKTVGHNIVGIVKGQSEPDSFVVLSAHYDHLGIQNGEVYCGADDNASGVATLLQAARHFSKHPPKHSMVFCFFDAEEMGLKGAAHFVEHLPAPLTSNSLLLNINLDMVSRNHYGNELFAVGTLANPRLKRLLEPARLQSTIALIFGHEGEAGTNRQDDWTMQSDQGPFAAKKIPFLYFGVEDHPEYHQPTDRFDKIDRTFFYESANFILNLIVAADRGL